MSKRRSERGLFIGRERTERRRAFEKLLALVFEFQDLSSKVDST